MPGEPWDATFASLIAIPGRFLWFWGTFCMHWMGGSEETLLILGEISGENAQRGAESPAGMGAE